MEIVHTAGWIGNFEFEVILLFKQVAGLLPVFCNYGSLGDLSKETSCFVKSMKICEGNCVNKMLLL